MSRARSVLGRIEGRLDAVRRSTWGDKVATDFRIVPYVGHGSGGRVVVRGWVLDDAEPAETIDGETPWAAVRRSVAGFLTSELPDWLAANKGLAPGGHAIVGAAQGGTGAVTLAEFYPNRFRYAGSMSGFLTPSNTFMNGAITAGLMQFGNADTRNMWGLPQLGRWKWHDPDVHSQLLVDNNTRLWVYSPQTLTCNDPAAMIGYCDQAQGSNRTFYSSYRSNGGSNGHFDFPTGGQHDWGSWSAQLGAMSGDLAAAIA